MNIEAQLPQPFVAGALHEIEIGRMVNHAPGIGILIIDTDRQGENLAGIIVKFISFRRFYKLKLRHKKELIRNKVECKVGLGWGVVRAAAHFSSHNSPFKPLNPIFGSASPKCW